MNNFGVHFVPTSLNIESSTSRMEYSSFIDNCPSLLESYVMKICSTASLTTSVSTIPLSEIRNTWVIDLSNQNENETMQLTFFKTSLINGLCQGEC